MYKIVFARQANKDKAKLKQAGLDGKARELLNAMCESPYITPPRYEKLSGDLKGLYSRRINVQHRLVYQVYEEERIIKVLSMWSHYGDN